MRARYYDSSLGRFLNEDPIFDGWNWYVYAANNPIMYSDPSGLAILTTLLVGALIGAAIGGTAAYNSASDSGLEGNDLFWETARGVGQGAAIGAVAGGLVATTGGVVAAYGAVSIAGTAMITGTAAITLRATEVAVLQGRTSAYAGRSGSQIVDDCFYSVFNNRRRVIGDTPITSPLLTWGSYELTSFTRYRVTGLQTNTYLRMPTNLLLPYGVLAYDWYHTMNSIQTEYPELIAYERGYQLR
jgi:hypothetical protein